MGKSVPVVMLLKNISVLNIVNQSKSANTADSNYKC